MLDEVKLEHRLSKIEMLLLTIDDKTGKIEEHLAIQNGKVNILWLDRTVWNWVIRATVLATPIVAVAASILTR